MAAIRQDEDGGIRSERGPTRTYFCHICSHEWTVALEPVGRFASIEQLVQRTGLRRDELATLADIGALNAFTSDRRSALWQVERAVRPAREPFKEGEDEPGARADYEDRTERAVQSLRAAATASVLDD